MQPVGIKIALSGDVILSSKKLFVTLTEYIYIVIVWRSSSATARATTL